MLFISWLQTFGKSVECIGNFGKNLTPCSRDFVASIEFVRMTVYWFLFRVCYTNQVALNSEGNALLVKQVGFAITLVSETSNIA